MSDQDQKTVEEIREDYESDLKVGYSDSETEKVGKLLPIIDRLREENELLEKQYNICAKECLRVTGNCAIMREGLKKILNRPEPSEWAPAPPPFKYVNDVAKDTLKKLEDKE